VIVPGAVTPAVKATLVADVGCSIVGVTTFVPAFSVGVVMEVPDVTVPVPGAAIALLAAVRPLGNALAADGVVIVPAFSVGVVMEVPDVTVPAPGAVIDLPGAVRPLGNTLAADGVVIVAAFTVLAPGIARVAAGPRLTPAVKATLVADVGCSIVGVTTFVPAFIVAAFTVLAPGIARVAAGPRLTPAVKDTLVAGVICSIAGVCTFVVARNVPVTLVRVEVEK
jgi:hypothetical protein